MSWSVNSFTMYNDYNGVCLSSRQVDRKFFTGAKERELMGKRKQIARNVMRTARFKWRSQALKKKILRQKIRKIRLENDYNTVANKFVKTIVSSKYKNWRINNVTRYIWKNGTAVKGRIEFKYKGQWGTVSSSSLAYHANTAHVFCKSMGFKFNKAWLIPYFGGGKGPTMVNSFYCSTKAMTSPTFCI